jgi:argininosuccinate synthase
MTRIVLAYPDTAWGQDPHRHAPDPLGFDEAIAWLGEQHHGAEVVALMLDFGQGRELEALRDRALGAGAVRAHVIDVADAFTARFLLPALRAGALYLDGRPSTPALARMMIAQQLVEVAAIEQTSLVAHGYSAADRSVTTAVKALDPSVAVITVPPSVLGSSGAGLSAATAGADAAGRAEPAFVDLTFVRGAPTAINGVPMPMIDLIGSLDMLSGTRGGRFNRRGTTAAMVMHDAHRGLQESVAASAADGPADCLRQGFGAQEAGRHVLSELAQRYAQLLAAGAWFSSERAALDAAVDRSEQSVNGTVRLQLVHDECRIIDVTREPKVEVRR